MQQVNLYQPPAEAGTTTFSARSIAMIWGGLILLLIAGQVLQAWRGVGIGDNLKQLLAYQKKLEGSVEKIQNVLKKRVPDAKLDTKLKNAQKRLVLRRETLVVVRSVTGRDRGLFSRQLTGLGEQRLRGLWLTHLNLSAQQGLVQLSGKANNPELVSRYMQYLGQHPDLVGIRFDAVEVSGGDPGLVDFRFGSMPTEKRKK